MKKNNGFTLIELLIAIAIIAILAAVGLVIFANVLKNSRNQKRINDLKTIVQGLELYRHDMGNYPPTSVFSLPSSTSLSSSVQTYITLVPKDPLSNRNYAYLPAPVSCSGSSCQNFVVCARAEGLNPSYQVTPCRYSGISCAGTAGDCNIGIASR